MCKTNEMKELRNQLKAHLVEWLSIIDVKPESIDDDAPLFGGGLGLDSLDAVEIVVMLQREYGISPKKMEKHKSAFTSVATLVEYILENRTK